MATLLFVFVWICLFIFRNHTLNRFSKMFQNNPNPFLHSRHSFKTTRDDYYEDELNNLFNKKFKFRFDEDWKLPNRNAWFSSPPWSVRELDNLKCQLNFHKSQLNDFNIEEWSCHTRRRNPAGEVCWKIKCLINPEFLTQAWTKFYECAYTFDIIPERTILDGKMVSLHLCEAPGAFITSLNHFLKSNHPYISWQWLASTLNPYYEGNSPSNMISDDRFMFHTLQNWDFGFDNTGNLMDWANSQAIINRVKSLGEVMLVTADGSIDCLQRPDAQEELTSPLHFCEIVTALQALSQGGTLIFKLFTMFEHSTVCLMYLVNHMFRDVNIYKPVTSRQGNSEVYAVCLNYKGREIVDTHLEVLKNAYGSNTYNKKCLFPLELIPKDFIKQIAECSYYFCSIQCQVIDNNLQMYLMQNIIPLQLDMKKLRSLVASEFLRVYNLKPLEYEEEILKGILHDENKINTNPRYHRGSYTDRQLYQTLNLKEKLKSLLVFLRSDVISNASIFFNETVRWVRLYNESSKLSVTFTYGKPYESIQSSKFIFVPIYKLYQQVLAENEFVKILENNRPNEKANLNYIVKYLTDFKTVTFPVYNLNTPFDSYERKVFDCLLEVLKEIKLGESLLLQNFNMLTHFNVSVVFLLARNCFEKLGFSADGIIFCNFVDEEGMKCLSEIETEYALGTEQKRVLSTLPIPIIYNDVYFNNIVFYNNTFYRNQCVEYCNIIEKNV